MNEESRKRQKTRRQRGNCSRGRHMTIPLSTMYKVKERGKNRRNLRGRMRERKEKSPREGCGKAEGDKETSRRNEIKRVGKLAELCRVDYLWSFVTEKGEDEKMHLGTSNLPKNAGERRPRDRAFYFVARPQQNRDCAIITGG